MRPSSDPRSEDTLKTTIPTGAFRRFAIPIALIAALGLLAAPALAQKPVHAVQKNVEPVDRPETVTVPVTETFVIIGIRDGRLEPLATVTGTRQVTMSLEQALYRARMQQAWQRALQAHRQQCLAKDPQARTAEERPEQLRERASPEPVLTAALAESISCAYRPGAARNQVALTSTATDP